jgi:AraC-like DNA-binding protein
MEAYVHGTSTRKVDDLVKALGVDAGISKSEVSRICGELSGCAFCSRASTPPPRWAGCSSTSWPAIAEFERELIIERTVDGLDATRARGRKGGRKPTLTEAAVHQAQAMYDSGQYTVEQIAAAFKTSRPTIYRALDPDTVGKKPTSPAKTRRAVASMVDSGAQLDDGL